MRIITSLILLLLSHSVESSDTSKEPGFILVEGATDCAFIKDFEIGLYQEQDVAKEIKGKVKALGGNMAVYDKNKTTGMLWHGTDGSSGVDTTLKVKAFSCK